MFIVDQLGNGGSERVVSILANKMQELNYQVSILMLHGTAVDYDINKEIKLISRENSGQKIFKHFEVIDFIIEEVKKINPDTIISFDAFNNIYSIIANFVLKKHLIISERNDPYQYPGNKLIRMVRDVLYRFADGLVFQTYDAKRYFNKKIQEKGTIILNPINIDLPNWQKDNTEKFIISVNRLSEQKNIPMLIDAFEKIKDEFIDINLKIYGKGPLQEYIANYITKKDLSDRVHLMGYSNDIYFEMSKAQLFVISSNYEGISNSMLEALAIGVPVISTNSPIGGAKMMIQDGYNGYLVETNDVFTLSLRMKNILSDEYLSNNFSNKSIKIREKLDPDLIARKWINFLKENRN